MRNLTIEQTAYEIFDRQVSRCRVLGRARMHEIVDDFFGELPKHEISEDKLNVTILYEGQAGDWEIGSAGHGGEAKVYAIMSSGAKRKIRHHVQHSPDGFSWGYFGAGPSELARCILWDFLGHEPHPSLCNKFKEDYVATWPMKSDWVLSAKALDSWMLLNRKIPRAMELK